MRDLSRQRRRCFSLRSTSLVSAYEAPQERYLEWGTAGLLELKVKRSNFIAWLCYRCAVFGVLLWSAVNMAKSWKTEIGGCHQLSLGDLSKESILGHMFFQLYQ